MSRDVACREVRRAVDATGLTRKQFAAEAGVDIGTLTDFLSGARWPQGPTRARVEKALGWEPGRISDLEAGQTESPAATVGLTIEDAILRDGSLIPEAKQHLLNQVGLLRRIQTAGPAVEEPHAAPTSLAARRVQARGEAILDDIEATTPKEPEPPAPPKKGRGGPGGRRGRPSAGR